MLSRRTGECRDWVEAFARNRELPVEWAGKGVRKDECVERHLRSMVRTRRYGVYFIFNQLSSCVHLFLVDVMTLVPWYR